MDEQTKEMVVRQALDLWINPEIERRREAGTLPEGFALSGAQVIFGAGDGPPEVRLNEEVKAAFLVKAKREVTEGEELTADDIASYEDILLTEDDPNAGHLTIVPH